MKKLMLSALLLSLLAACASAPTQGQKAAVVDKSISQAAPTEKPAEAQAAPVQPIAVNPLTDPDNILSHRSIYYDFDKSVVKPEYKPMIEAHARYLLQHPDAKVTLQGNTDERGSREYNLALGQRRANSVKKIMVVLGVPGNQVTTVSFGEEKPKATCHNESCWKVNRRTDIVYQGE
jgi:peptidoglycan-associated lipoprotein